MSLKGQDVVMRTIEPDNLFKYTSGRWLVNEEHQLAQRIVKFDVNNLCRLAASLFSETTRCVRIDKLEGNFNKAFLLRMNDGNEVMAKVPCRNAGPPSYTTASEVATLKFLRSHTSIRVPEVFAWSSDSANAVGAEYIIMEKIPGVALAERWETMNSLQRYKLIGRIVEMEKELGSLEFPAYGSLFLRDTIPDELHCYPLPSALDPAGVFCIGPSCDRSWRHEGFSSITKSMPGPWRSLTEFALSIARHELAFAANSQAEVRSQLHNFSDSQSVNEYADLLEKAAKILPVLSCDSRVRKSSVPVLWHTDLHLGNIFVSRDDPTNIEGIIDWQSSCVAPLFMQSHFPVFVQPPKAYNPGVEVPSLPENFDELSPEQQQQAIKDKDRASQSKYYEMSTLAYNKRVYDAMKLDRRLWEPFTCCRLFSSGSLVPLRNCLIRISQDWALLDLPGHCPFEFTDEELHRHEEQVTQYQDRVYLWDLAKSQLGTDDTGWVPVERWEAANGMNRYLFDIFVETMSDEHSPEGASKIWPFPPKMDDN